MVYRRPFPPGRFQQFIVVTLMFMVLKSSHESRARGARLPRGGGWRGTGHGDASRFGARGPGLTADAGAADISGLKDLTRVVEFGGDEFDDGSGVGGTGGRGPGVVNGTVMDSESEAPTNDWRGAPFPALYPNDIAGTYKGKWSLVQRLDADGLPNGTITNHLPGMHAFLDEINELGTAVLQLRSKWDPLKRVQTVTGEAAIRDGKYISDDDQHIKINGVYVEPTGQLVMLGESRIGNVFSSSGGEVGHDTDEDDSEKNKKSKDDDEESKSIASSNSKYVRVPYDSIKNDSPAAREKYRAALRIAARDVAQVPFHSGYHAGVGESVDGNGNNQLDRPETVVGSPGLSQMNRNERKRNLDDSDVGTYTGKCSFTLKLWVNPGEFKPIDPEDAALKGSDDNSKDRLTVDLGRKGGYDREAPSVSSTKLARTRAETWARKKETTDRSINSLPGEGGGGDPVLQGLLVSEECGFEMRLTAHWFELKSYYQKATGYAVMILFATSVQIYLITKQSEFSGTQSGLAKISLASIGWQAVLDSYQCLLHLTAGIVADPIFHVFSATAFLQFSLFSVFEMRLMLQIWKSRRPNGEQNWLEIRRDLSNLYSRFYGGFILGFVFMYWQQKRAWLIALVVESFWVPQICWSAWVNAKKPLSLVYVFGTSCTRLLLPLYLFGCPSNFVRLKPDYWTCLMLITWVGVQVSLLLAQHYFGPRCFLTWVPEGWLPVVYDYFRKVDEEVLTAAGAGDPERGEAGGVDCVICMAPVECQSIHERMVTPCNHFFHKPCLERWMDVKMECPTCRGTLPPL